MTDKEDLFRQWYTHWATKLNLDQDPDNPEHHYDYRAAFAAGVSPQPQKDGSWHWPSRFKAKDHPNRYVNGEDTLLQDMYRR